ncbi:hypothetical protein [uncultured Paludibaculum sp.]|uniref:hypothetical protein n=1 Tax=uncultured Paludibaculum sp. TaxID=1765020 RepID=UPI002AAAB8C0|nr:hypothetical protein [uncultured Paludibaculum sp.]
MHNTTLAVRPGLAGDNRYFILILRPDGTRLMDAKPYSRLTKAQKRMVRKGK